MRHPRGACRGRRPRHRGDASDLNSLKAAAEVEAARYDRKLVVKPANSPGVPSDAGTEYGQTTGASPADIFRVQCSAAPSWRLPTRATAKADRRLLVHTQRSGMRREPTLQGCAHVGVASWQASQFRCQRAALHAPSPRVCCETCHAEHLVAFSCKRRGFCPSCGARRVADDCRDAEVERRRKPKPRGPSGN
ncbi:MAG: hypothetical protein BMS9Abin01_1091 [Gammaproteobacteria bacterium]|nr:MAG: hypothetical protein BMS9Abin01_1091 [Gammaproteobacteria bacterium]